MDKIVEINKNGLIFREEQLTFDDLNRFSLRCFQFRFFKIQVLFMYFIHWFFFLSLFLVFYDIFVAKFYFFVILLVLLVHLPFSDL